MSSVSTKEGVSLLPLVTVTECEKLHHGTFRLDFWKNFLMVSVVKH